MIRIDHPLPSAPIVRIRISRSLLGRATYTAAAYWVDGLLIDTGCAHTADLFTQTATSLGVDRVVNTHSHEDHKCGDVLCQGPVSEARQAEAPALRRSLVYHNVWWCEQFTRLHR